VSGLTGTWTELIFANRSSGTPLASFTTEASAAAGIAELGTTANFINAGLPANFFNQNNAVGKVIRVHLGGVFSSVAGSATFSWSLRWTSASGVLIATTTALTPSTLTNAMWDAEVQIVCLTTGPSTTATARAWGKIVLENSAIATGTTITSAFCTGSSQGTPTPTSLTTAGFDSTVPLAIVPTVTCSASNASNAVTLNCFEIWGSN
jgi:hypothetical protein